MTRLHSPEFERALLQRLPAGEGWWRSVNWLLWIGVIGVSCCLALGAWILTMAFNDMDSTVPLRPLICLDILGLFLCLTGCVLLRSVLHGVSTMDTRAILRCPIAAKTLLATRWWKFALSVTLTCLCGGLILAVTEWLILRQPNVFPVYLVAGLGMSLFTISVSTWLAYPRARKPLSKYSFVGIFSMQMVFLSANQMNKWITTAPPQEIHRVFGYLPTGWVTNPIREWMWGWPVDYELIGVAAMVAVSGWYARTLLLRRIRFDDLLVSGDANAAAVPPTKTAVRKLASPPAPAPAPEANSLFAEPELGWADRLLWKWFTPREASIAVMNHLPWTNFSLFLNLTITLVVLATAITVVFEWHPMNRIIFFVIGGLLGMTYILREGMGRAAIIQVRRQCFAPILFPIGISEFIRMTAKLAFFRLVCGAVLGVAFCYLCEGTWRHAPRWMAVYWLGASSLVMNGLAIEILMHGDYGSLFRARGWLEVPVMLVAGFAPVSLLFLYAWDGLGNYLLMAAGGSAVLSGLWLWVLVGSYRRGRVSYRPDVKLPTSLSGAR